MRLRATRLGRETYPAHRAAIADVIGSLFSNGEQGAVVWPADLTDEKLRWRRNLFDWSEFPHGLSDAATNGDVEATTMDGFDGAIHIGRHESAASYVRQALSGTGAEVGMTVQFSMVVEMDDGGPISLSGANADAVIYLAGAIVSGQVTVDDLGGGRYRLRVARTLTTLAGATGIQKNSTSSDRGFKVTAFELNPYPGTPYQKIGNPDWDFIEAFPNHLLFRDEFGAQPVMSVEQTVGLSLDPSKGLERGPELMTNGDFSNGTDGWVIAPNYSGTYHIAVNDGVLEIENEDSQIRYMYPVTCEVGAWYEVTLEGRKKTAGAGAPSALPAFGIAGYPTGNFVNNAEVYLDNKAAPCSTMLKGRMVFRATDTTHYVTLASRNVPASGGAGTVFEFANVSCRKILGNHLYQSASGSRPTISARVNLLTDTRKMDAVNFANGTRSPGQLGPTGLMDGVRFTGPSTGPLFADFTATSTVVTYSVAIKAGPGMAVNATLLLRNATTSTNFAAASVNLSTGTMSGTGWSMRPLGNGYYLCTYTQSSGISVGDSIRVYLGASGSTTEAFDLIVAQPQVTNGADIKPYQWVDSDTSYDRAGFPTYLKFDGVDDYLVTSDIDCTGFSEVAVMIGLEKMKNSSIAMIAEMSANANSNNGSFYVSSPYSAGNPNIGFALRGNSAIVIRGTPLAAPSMGVASGLGDIGGNLSRIRLGGVTKDEGTAAVGTGNLGNYPLYIGMRGGSTLPFNGNIFAFAFVTRMPSDDELVAVEHAINEAMRYRAAIL